MLPEILVVGLAPEGDAEFPDSYGGRRLLAWFGASPEMAWRVIYFRNLHDRPRVARHDAAAARHLLQSDPSHVVIALGQRVAAAIAGEAVAPMCCTVHAGRIVFHLPHPSSRNRWYNTEARRGLAAALLRAVVEMRGDLSSFAVLGQPVKVRVDIVSVSVEIVPDTETQQLSSMEACTVQP